MVSQRAGARSDMSPSEGRLMSSSTMSRDGAFSEGAPTVSVIVPIFNTAKFLPDTVASVEAQTWSRWELLLVDDGSTDGSSALARGCSERNPERVTYLEHENHQNRGQAASRNLAAAHASGEWLAPLDSDDIWTPDKLQEQLALSSCYPKADLVYTASIAWFSWDPHAVDEDQLVAPPDASNAYAEPPQRAYTWLEESSFPLPSSVLVRRATYHKVGGCEESLPGAFEDFALLLKIALNSPVVGDSRPLVLHRERSDSTFYSSWNQGAHADNHQCFLRWALAYLDRSGMPDADALAAAARRGVYKARLYDALLRRERTGGSPPHGDDVAPLRDRGAVL